MHHDLACVCTVSSFATQAKKRCQKSAVTSDEPVELQELSIVLHALVLAKKPSLSLLSIESWSRSEEGRGGQQMLPELSNKAFSTKSTQYIH